MLVVREALVKAKVTTIWKLFSALKWEEWDVDVTRLEGVSEGGLRDGGTFVFVMKEGNSKIPMKLTDVVDGDRLTFGGAVAGGTVYMEGKFKLTPVDQGGVRVLYSFEVRGLFGGLVSFFKASRLGD